MKQNGRYAIKGLDEAEFEPGSGGRVLKNLLGIKNKREMDTVEAREQLRAVDELVEMYGSGLCLYGKNIQVGDRSGSWDSRMSPDIGSGSED
jgi:hypothetical protein